VTTQSSTATADAVIHRFYAYRVTMGAGFTSSFLVAFLAAREVSFTTVGVGIAALSLVNVVGEVPAGYIGDRWGRRPAMLAASATYAVVGVGWLVARTAPSIVALYALSGVAVSFQSGAGSSWLYETLAEFDATERYSAVASRSLSLLRWTQVVTTLVGAGLYVLSPTYPFVASALAGVVGVAVTWSLPATERFRDAAATTTAPEDGDADAERPDGDRVGPVAAARAMRTFVRRPAVRTVSMFSGVFASAVVLAGRYVQPVVDRAVRANGLVVVGFDVPGVVVLGVVGAGYTTVSALVVDQADALESSLGQGPAIAGTYGVCALAMLAPLSSWYGPVPLVAAAAVAAVAFQALPSVAAVVRDAYLHAHADSQTRATTMSAVALAMSVIRLPVVLAGGVLADAFSPTAAVVAAGAFALCGGAFLRLVDGPLTVATPDGGDGGEDGDDGDVARAPGEGGRTEESTAE
jgi:MFS family permease